MTAYIVAVVHLLTFGLGFGSCWARANGLKKLKDASGLPAVFAADNFWGIASLLWLSTGFWRVLGGLAKGSEYYFNSTAFYIKMGIFVLILLLELKPMITLIKWRSQFKKEQSIDFSAAPLMAKLTYIELILLIPMVFMAAAMARGMWY